MLITDADTVFNILKLATDSGSTEGEMMNALRLARRRLHKDGSTLDDLRAALLVVSDADEETEMLRQDNQGLRMTIAVQERVINVLKADNARMSVRPLAEVTPEEEEAHLEAISEEHEKAQAMQAGGDFALFEAVVRERFGDAYGWQTAFSDATGIHIREIQNWRMDDFVPAEMFVRATTFIPVPPRSRITWTPAMYGFLYELMGLTTIADDTDMADRLSTFANMKITVTAVRAAKYRLRHNPSRYLPSR